MQFDSEEIETQLKKRSRDKRVAFALRSAMRILPLLANQKTLSYTKDREVFSFWDKNAKEYYLLVVYRSYSIALNKLFLDSKVITNLNFPSVSSAINAAYSDVIACQVIEAASTDIFYTYDVYASDNAITNEIYSDLSSLKTLSIPDFLQQKLWSKDIPDNWQQLQDQFKQDVLSLNAGFDVWLDWYDDVFLDKVTDQLQVFDRQ